MEDTMTDPWAPQPMGASWPPGLGPPLHDGALAPAPAPGRRRRPVATALAGVLVIGALGFAATNLASGDGADSPEGAVEALFDAIDQEDAIGVVEAMEPAERRILMDTLREVEEQTARLRLADDDIDLRSFPGVDLEVSGLELRTEQLADDVVAVELVAGRVSTSAELDELPLGPVIDDAIARSEDEGDEVEIDGSDDVELAGGRLVAVRRDGGWHVSLLYSLAEQARREADEPLAYPSPGSAIAAKGAADPEAAVREGIAAAQELDVERLIELTDPVEGRVLHEYGPLLVDLAAEEDDGDGPAFEISNLELSVSDGPAGTKVVRADTATMTYGDDDVTTEVTYDGTCSTITTRYSEAYREEYLAEWGDEDDLSWMDDEELRTCRDEVYGPFALFAVLWAPTALEVVVAEHDGAWYLSPGRTMVESLLGPLRDLDDAQIQRTVRIWSGEWWLAEPPELWEACGIEAPGLDATAAEGEAAYDDCIDALPEDYDGPWGFGYGWFGSDDGSFDGDEYEPLPEDECYEDVDFDADDPDAQILACLEDLAAQGVIDQETVDSFRCQRVYDAIWSDEELSDAEIERAYEVADEQFEACMAGEVAVTTAVPTTVPTTAPTTTTPRPTTSVPRTTTTAPATTAPPTTAPAAVPTTAVGD
jgi:hypothetical protein